MTYFAASNKYIIPTRGINVHSRLPGIGAQRVWREAVPKIVMMTVKIHGSGSSGLKTSRSAAKHHTLSLLSIAANASRWSWAGKRTSTEHKVTKNFPPVAKTSRQQGTSASFTNMYHIVLDVHRGINREKCFSHESMKKVRVENNDTPLERTSLRLIAALR